jgi:hypothetical protein
MGAKTNSYGPKIYYGIETLLVSESSSLSFIDLLAFFFTWSQSAASQNVIPCPAWVKLDRRLDA